jgi:Zn-dependent membrane protease YugP
MYYGMTTGVYYILTIGLLIMSLIISGVVKSLFRKYSAVAAPFTGRQAAERILRANGIYDVAVTGIGGTLTDNYSPMNRTLSLSENVIDTASVAAVAIAAHESGHAIQHAQDYVPLKLRSLSVPVARIGSWLSWPVIVLGIAFGYADLTKIGIILFCTVIAFQLITLPVEFNASRRALAVLGSSYMLQGSELTGARKVLNAAALTYVASLFTSVLQLLRILLIFRGNRR